MFRDRASIRRAAWALVALALLAAACTPNAAAPATPLPDQGARSAAGAIQARAGQDFQITLESNRTTGYEWQLARPLDEAVVKFVNAEYRAPGGAEQRPGAGGSEVWTFHAVGKGQTTIAMKYVRPWEKDVTPTTTRRFDVTVQ